MNDLISEQERKNVETSLTNEENLDFVKTTIDVMPNHLEFEEFLIGRFSENATKYVRKFRFHRVMKDSAYWSREKREDSPKFDQSLLEDIASKIDYKTLSQARDGEVTFTYLLEFIGLFEKPLLREFEFLVDIINSMTDEDFNVFVTSLPPEKAQLINVYRDCEYGICRCFGVTKAILKSNLIARIPRHFHVLRNLVQIDLEDCLLTEFPEPFTRMPWLKDINLAKNRNLSIVHKDIGNIVSLEKLDLSETAIRRLPFSITFLRQLTNIAVNGVAMEDNDPIVENFLRNINNRIRRVNPGNWSSDSQNVHDSSLQQNVERMVRLLMSDNILIKGKNLKWNDELRDIIINDEHINEKVKRMIIQTCDDSKDTHSILGVSFKDIFPKVYSRIVVHEDSEDPDGKYQNMIRRLSEELNESECKCFTGRITRLINSLNGFYPDIQLYFGVSEDLANIYNVSKLNPLSISKSGEYSAFNHCFVYFNEMIERGYGMEQFKVWGHVIIEEIVESKNDSDFLMNFFNNLSPISEENGIPQYGKIDLSSESIKNILK